MRRQRNIVLSMLIGLVFIWGTHVPQLAVLHSGVLQLGLAMGVFYAVYYAKFRFPRHLVIALSSVFASILVAFLVADTQQAFLAFSCILGVVMLAAGAGPFLKLIRTPEINVEQMS